MKIIPLIAVSACALGLAACEHTRGRGDYGYRHGGYVERDRGHWDRDRHRDRYERSRHDDRRHDGDRDRRRGDYRY